jgi:IS30 family transposase
MSILTEGRPGKRTGRNPDTAPRFDPNIIGRQGAVIGTMAERKARHTSLVHPPRELGHGTAARTKNGPAPAGHGAQSMNRALVSKAAELPPGSLRSLTWDRGKELSGHVAFTEQTGVGVNFARRSTSWVQGVSETVGTSSLTGCTTGRHSRRRLVPGSPTR